MIHVDLERFVGVGGGVEGLAGRLWEEQGLRLGWGASGGGAFLRYDNCLNIEVFKSMLARLEDFARNNS